MNQLVLNQIKLVQQSAKPTLILVPFLYGYHHPGLTIDVVNQKAIYLDPFGTPASAPEVKALLKQLQDLNFKVERESRISFTFL